MYINRAADLEKARQPRRALKPKAPHWSSTDDVYTFHCYCNYTPGHILT
jgi:hypothetical protein